ncbi:type II CAAX prenyl endopeptidase Rce1 family protein [Salinigranum salinum]|uniref:type II CAAX prenyl endopeptidase Rce1 family protein n=1 Tax=Salinigranum salinum TaxID=1364937 RepID=UPI001260F103|nr:CPBP family glutamic-type intramembrane protease [Salinigranum salinum]
MNTFTRRRSWFARSVVDHPVVAALALVLTWTLATYVLEGARLTLLRPEAIVDRLLYAIVANVLLGTVLGLWIVRNRLRTDPARVGFRRPVRTVVGVVVALGLGAGAYLAQSPPTTDPLVVTNAFAQTLVVSIAEIVVCWVVLGVAVERAIQPRVGRVAAMACLVVTASVAFGLYHVAHSPPFDTPAMVVLLTGVGVVTSLVFVVSRDLYATVAFHNALALTGVTRALAASGRLSAFADPAPVLWATAIVALAALVATDYWLVRRRR